MTVFKSVSALLALLVLAPMATAQNCSDTGADDITNEEEGSILFGTNPANSIPQELGQSFRAPCDGELDSFKVQYRAPNSTSGGTTISGNVILFDGPGTAQDTLELKTFSFTLENDRDYRDLRIEFDNAPVVKDNFYTVFFDITSGAQVAQLEGREPGGYSLGAMFSSNTGSATRAGAPGNFDLTFEAQLSSLGTASEEAAESRTLSLHPTEPNPAADRVRVPFTLRAPADVRLAVYDALGREVAVVSERAYGAGDHAEALDASSLPAGLYVVRLVAGGETVLRTLAVAR